MFGRTGIFATGLGFGMLVLVMALLSSGSFTRAADDLYAIKAWVDYDCRNCSFTLGDYVKIYYKENLNDPNPPNPTYTENIYWTPKGYRAIKHCPLSTGYYLVTYQIQDESCVFIQDRTWQYVDCSDDVEWHNYCQEVHP